MAVFDLFSKRQKRLRGDVPDVYVYDDIPDHLRVQIVHIWSRSIGTKDQYSGTIDMIFGNRGIIENVKNAYDGIVDILCREYGYFQLPGYENDNNRYKELLVFFFREKDVERVLDVVELSFLFIDKDTRSYDYISRKNASQIADDAIEELNVRFKEHGVGFQFSGGQIVRVDSEYVHSEAIKPAIRLLHENAMPGHNRSS